MKAKPEGEGDRQRLVQGTASAGGCECDRARAGVTTLVRTGSGPDPERAPATYRRPSGVAHKTRRANAQQPMKVLRVNTQKTSLLLR